MKQRFQDIQLLMVKLILISLVVRFKNIPKFDNPDIVGYKITRSDRKGGNGTVIARGIMTNVRSYLDAQSNQTILYSNYTVNDLSPDKYLIIYTDCI
jgi:hypothetical protein